MRDAPEAAIGPGRANAAPDGHPRSGFAHGNGGHCDDGASEPVQVRARVLCLAGAGAAPTGTGGKVQLLGISKRGDSYLRTLLVHGARALVCCGKAPSAWQSELSQRRHKNVVIVAQAAKTARIIWAVTAKGQATRGAIKAAGQDKARSRDRSKPWHRSEKRKAMN